MNDLLDFVKNNFRYENGNLYRLKSTGGEKIDKVAGYETTCNGKKYRKICINYKTCYVHHIIFLLHHGYIPKVIDHIDRNSLNNHIENLRESTQSQNCANKLKNKNNTSGYKGVTFCKRKKMWVAQIGVNYKRIGLGYFDTPEDASEAYIKAAKDKFGEFSCHE